MPRGQKLSLLPVGSKRLYRYCQCAHWRSNPVWKTQKMGSRGEVAQSCIHSPTQLWPELWGFCSSRSMKPMLLMPTAGKREYRARLGSLLKR